MRNSHSWVSKSLRIFFYYLLLESGTRKLVLSTLISVMRLWNVKARQWGSHPSLVRKTGCYCGSLWNQIENVWCLADASLDGFLVDHRKSYNKWRGPLYDVSFWTGVSNLRCGSLQSRCLLVGMSVVKCTWKGSITVEWYVTDLVIIKLLREFKGIPGVLCVSIEAKVEDQ